MTNVKKSGRDVEQQEFSYIAGEIFLINATTLEN